MSYDYLLRTGLGYVRNSQGKCNNKDSILEVLIIEMEKQTRKNKAILRPLSKRHKTSADENVEKKETW